jgi:hypothetical protein
MLRHPHRQANPIPAALNLSILSEAHEIGFSALAPGAKPKNTDNVCLAMQL